MEFKRYRTLAESSGPDDLLKDIGGSFLGYWINVSKTDIGSQLHQRCVDFCARNNFVVPILRDLVIVLAGFIRKHLAFVNILMYRLVFLLQKLKGHDLVEHGQIHQFFDIRSLCTLEDPGFQRRDGADAEI